MVGEIDLVDSEMDTLGLDVAKVLACFFGNSLFASFNIVGMYRFRCLCLITFHVYPQWESHRYLRLSALGVFHGRSCSLWGQSMIDRAISVFPRW